MALNLGKFVGRLFDPKKIVPIVASFASGGAGAAAMTALSGASFGSSRQTSAVVPATKAAFVQPSSSFPGTTGMSGAGGAAFPVRGTTAIGTAVTGDVYNALLKVADRLGVRIVNPNAVVRVGRNLLSKLIRFSRATPGLTIVSMLANLGLTAFEATTLVSWFSTAGKRHKRIRVTNVKALNRSVRRMEGFLRLSRRVEAAIGRRTVSRTRSSSRRCRKCRKSPCGC